MESIKLDIPGLGPVTLRPLSFGVMRAAFDQSTQADESGRSEVFTNFVLSALLAEPPQTSKEVSKLPSESVAALVNAAVDLWGIRDEFDKTSNNLSPQERLYFAYRESFKELAATIRNLTSFSESFTEAIQPILSNISEQFVQQQIRQALSEFYKLTIQYQAEIQRILTSFTEEISRSVEEAKATSQALGAPITRAGFWISPSAPFPLFSLLKRLVDNGEATPESIRQAIVGYFEADDFYYLKSMVDGWKRNLYFIDRMSIITEALDAHINGKYSLSIPTLLPLVEGIMIEIVGRRATKRESIKAWAGNAIEKMYTDAMREASKDAVIAYVTGITVYGKVEPENYFTPQRFPEWLKQHGLTGDQVLQRHAILHGVQKDYASKENSFRAFFLLDVLSWIEREEEN